MDTLLYFCDLRGPPKPSLRTPRGSMDPRLRTYAIDEGRRLVVNFTIPLFYKYYIHFDNFLLKGEI